MKLRFITDFAKNWKAGDIVEAEFLSDSEILVGNVARIDATLLMKHCEVVTETESQEVSNRENHSTNLCKDTDNLFEALEQDPRWIPVSERLPEPNENNGLIARYYLIQNEYEDMLVAKYDGIGWQQMYQHEYLEDDVIAWMPLPTPYEQ